ncbi:MAG: hypothetical protein HC849_30910 [Oscillatoriales cyanobacterium RU_3_3]|nr:hypothetical protein [Microcoleus sp. SU_5_3]NJL66778.1 hypothetical protein [Microcoleus sp. SM1_3_4]NJM63580.1 hypothetical protein [Oscillatoriales cyanobacterium RU_3_3]NJR25744.1 hypothetical protein [Richelia sp. CSU_2_1]NJS09212.1 hypothetical protein [Microcoleus sp. CSU_2_2]
MLKSYEAIYENGQVKWLSDAPSVTSARVIVTVLEETVQSAKHRTPAAAIAGKARILGDLVSPVVDEQDWECLT